MWGIAADGIANPDEGVLHEPKHIALAEAGIGSYGSDHGVSFQMIVVNVVLKRNID